MDEGDWNKFEDRPQLESVMVDGIELRPGDHVRLRPRSGGDVLDMLLAGKSATIAAIEQDYDENVHLAVVIDDDPGRDLGLQKHPGHRFFFSVEEVQPMKPLDEAN